LAYFEIISSQSPQKKSIQKVAHDAMFRETSRAKNALSKFSLLVTHKKISLERMSGSAYTPLEITTLSFEPTAILAIG
jgi:hypothetical protein